MNKQFIINYLLTLDYLRSGTMHLKPSELQKGPGGTRKHSNNSSHPANDLFKFGTMLPHAEMWNNEVETTFLSSCCPNHNK